MITMPGSVPNKPNDAEIRTSGETFTQDDVDNNRVKYTHDGGETLSDGFTYSVSDGLLTSDPVSVTLSITPVNDQPVVTASPGTQNYIENAAAVAVDAGLTLADVDNVQLTGAAVSLVSGFVASLANAFQYGKCSGSIADQIPCVWQTLPGTSDFKIKQEQIHHGKRQKADEDKVDDSIDPYKLQSAGRGQALAERFQTEQGRSGCQ